MTERVGIAVIGCGDVATQRHLPAIASRPDAQLAACCDVDLARAVRAAQGFGASRACTDLNDVLQDPAIDAVIIATPPWVTPHLTIRALQSGKDVLSEKPMALTLETAQQVREVEQQSGNFVQVGFVLRHGPIFGSLHRWISEGRLGSPLDLRISVFDEVLNPAGDPAHYQRIMATLKHGAPCIHDGAHTMDHLHYLLSAPPARLVSWGRTTRPEFPRPNLNSAMIEFIGGHRACVEIGWFLPEFPRSEWSIIGPRGIAWFDQPSGTVSLRSESGNEDIQLQEDWFVSCFRHQLETFVRGIRSRIPPEPGSAAGIASLRLCHAFESGMSQPFTTLGLPMP